MESQDRKPTFPQQDSGVPVTPAHSPDPPEPSASRPEPPKDPSRAASARSEDEPSLADAARERTRDEKPGEAQADEGGPAVGDLTSGLSESNPAQGL